MAEKNKLRVAAVADLHPHEESYGRYLELFNKIESNADVLLLCGDLTNVGNPKEAMNLADGLRHLKIPMLAVLGNHDYESGQQEELVRILSRAGVKFLEVEPFELEGVGFAGVKGFGGGFNSSMLGSFGEKSTKDFVSASIEQALKLENSLKTLEMSEHMVVALHYAPIKDTVEGEHLEIYPFLGCSRLAEVIDRFNVSAVFHGHAHHGKFQGKTSKGTPVYNCTFELMNKTNPQQPYALIEV